MRPLRASEAVRLGLRAASRNPELAFGKALLDLGASLLSLLPVLLAAALLSGAVTAGDLEAAIEGISRLGWPLAGATLTIFALSLASGAAFWAGAVPLLTADAELGQRPPAGAFGRLVGVGFGRVLLASLLSIALSLVFTIASIAAIAAGTWLYLRRSAPGIAAGLALAVTLAVAGSLLLEQLSRLVVVRAAALGEGPWRALSGAARIVGERLSSVLGIALAFWLLQLVVGTVGAAFGGSISSAGPLSVDGVLLAAAPRLALYVATAAILAWLEVARQGALGALVANDAGLLEVPEPEPLRRQLVPTQLVRPGTGARIEAQPPTEQIIEALPVPGELVIEALPVPDGQVIEALPIPEGAATPAQPDGTQAPPADEPPQGPGGLPKDPKEEQ